MDDLDMPSGADRAAATGGAGAADPHEDRTDLRDEGAPVPLAGSRTTLPDQADDPVVNVRPGELRLAGRRLPVDCLRVARRPYEWEQEHPTDEFTIGIAMTDRLHRLEQDNGDGWNRMHTRGIDSFYVGPPLDSWRSVAHDPGEALFVAAPIDPLAGLLGTDAEGLAESLRPLHDDFRADALVRRLGLDIWEASADGDPSADLFVEGTLAALVARTVALARGRDWRSPAEADPLGAATGPTDARGDPSRLDDRRLRAVLDHLESHLDGPLSIAALAQVAAMSPGQLGRRFRAATGEPVWRHVQRRRLARACELLRGTQRPIVEVASACGYASQSHLTTAMRRALGTTPARYRAGD